MTKKTTFALAAVLALAGAAAVARTQELSEADLKELEIIRAAYAAAMNMEQPGAALDAFLAQYVDPSDFSATLYTGQVVTNPAEFNVYVGKMRELLGVDGAGPKGEYKLKDVKTQARILMGDTLYSAGTTEEHVRAATVKDGKKTLGKPLDYKGLWTAVLKKGADGRWKIRRANLKVIAGVSPSKLAELRKIASASLPGLKTSSAQ